MHNYDFDELNRFDPSLRKYNQKMNKMNNFSYLDYFHVTSYDFSTARNRCQLYAPKNIIINLINELEIANIHPDKILVGLEFGGRKVKLFRPENNGLEAECSADVKYLPSYAIQKKMENGKWTTINGENGNSAYSFCG